LCKRETVLQVLGIGPFKIIWLNPDFTFQLTDAIYPSEGAPEPLS